MNFLSGLDDMELEEVRESRSEVESPQSEIDVPPEDEPFYDKLTPIQQKEWNRWLKNMGFMKQILILMLLVYVIDLFVSKGQSDLTEPMFEVLKTVLFTVSGYVFAKNQDN